MNDTKFVSLEGDDLPLNSPEAIRVLVKSILKEDEDSPILVESIKFIESSAPRGIKYQDIINLLKRWATECLKSEPNRSAELNHAIERIIEHQTETEQARFAYSVENKPNPSAIFWPDPTRDENPLNLLDEEIFVKTIPLLDKTTPVGSAGSCFACEIAYRLQEEHFNYVITENYRHPHQRGEFPPGCAAYGAIFNSQCLRQLIEKAFKVRELPKLVAKINYQGKIQYCDPFREAFFFNSAEEIEDNYEAHREACRKAFETCKVFCLTIGLNEVWMLKAYDAAIPRYPAPIYSSLLEYKVLTVQDNVNNLQRTLDIWRSYNPDIKLIISVSPIPLTATFRANEHHAIAANGHSKATLRVAVEEFANRNEGVFYFPAYETVMHTVKGAWEKDQRHVSQAAVDKVMRLFKKTYVSN